MSPGYIPGWSGPMRSRCISRTAALRTALKTLRGCASAAEPRSCASICSTRSRRLHRARPPLCCRHGSPRWSQTLPNRRRRRPPPRRPPPPRRRGHRPLRPRRPTRPPPRRPPPPTPPPRLPPPPPPQRRRHRRQPRSRPTRDLAARWCPVTSWTPTRRTKATHAPRSSFITIPTVRRRGRKSTNMRLNNLRRFQGRTAVSTRIHHRGSQPFIGSRIAPSSRLSSRLWPSSPAPWWASWRLV
mmetsp:Transcript_12833/g.32866  ORF Transcript_12833/g.32866 Transcript_12833/m.32866 type:complete len:242 (-) Transcript_12833:326-1051(-)